MKREKSEAFYKESLRWIPGGVNSPVRAFKAVGGHPVFFQKASGAYLYDVDGNRYLDFLGSWGPAILGHNHPEVLEALEQAAQNGVSFGMSSPPEIEMAKMICTKIPEAESVRFVNSGTEATMTALRLVRAFTGRDLIVKFEGCYHGHSDGLLVKAGSGGATLGIPSSPGVPKGYTKNTITLPYNHLPSLESILKKKKVAAVIVEPVAGNMGVIVPKREFIAGMRDLCTETGALLIFDEVMTGFRVHEQGAQGYFGVQADLICLGKIIGGGLPVGALAGKRKIMSRLAPEGNVYQAGTLSGNPLAMAVGLKTLQIFYQNEVMDKINSLARYLEQGMAELTHAYPQISFSILGGMFTLFFTSKPPKNFKDVERCNLERFGEFFRFMLENKIFLPPSQFEANFLSLAHSQEHLDAYLESAKAFLERKYA